MRDGSNITLGTTLVVLVLGSLLLTTTMPATEGGFETGRSTDPIESSNVTGSSNGNLQISQQGNLPGGPVASGGSFDVSSPSVGRSVSEQQNFYPSESTSREVHFQSDRVSQSYYRTAVFNSFSQGQWYYRPDGSSSVSQCGTINDCTSVNITLRESTKRLPAPGYAVSIEFKTEDYTVITGDRPSESDSGDVFVTPQGTIYAEQEIPAGTEYQVQTIDMTTGAPATSRPTSQTRSMPDSISPEVYTLADDVIGEKRSRSEKVRALVEYMNQEYSYQRTATHADGKSPVNQFLFESLKGNCEYYASSLVFLLRAEDIPARYAIGYTNGQQQGGINSVRSIDAHAWVEVYIDGRWVQIDPTPARERIQTESDQLSAGDSSGGPQTETQPETDYNATGGGISQGGITDAELDEITSDTVQMATNSEPIIGSRLNISVSNAPPGSQLFVDGAVQARGISEDEQITISVPEKELVSLRLQQQDGTVLLQRNLTTEARLSLSHRTSQEELYIHLQSGESSVPIVDADVVVETANGGEVAELTTNQSGSASVKDPNGNVTITATAYDDTVSETVNTATTQIELTSTSRILIPGQQATVSVYRGDTPLRNATVAVNGQTVTNTSASGNSQITLPIQNQISITVHKDGEVVASKSEGGLFIHSFLISAMFSVGLLSLGALFIGALRGNVMGLTVEFGTKVGSAVFRIESALTGVLSPRKWNAGVQRKLKVLQMRFSGRGLRAIALEQRFRGSGNAILLWIYTVYRQAISSDEGTEKTQQPNQLQSLLHLIAIAANIESPETKTPKEIIRRAAESGMDEGLLDELLRQYRQEFFSKEGSSIDEEIIDEVEERVRKYE